VCFDCTAGGNLVLNCDFSDGLTNWEAYIPNNAATMTNVNGMMAVNVTSQGGADYEVQPLQGNLLLTEGVTYVFKFNAYGTSPRDGIVTITRNGTDYASFSGKNTFSVTTEMQLFTYEFTMPPAPANGDKMKFEFDLGGATFNPLVPNTVFIDNVFLAPKP
jgi:hypothetical protein